MFFILETLHCFKNGPLDFFLVYFELKLFKSLFVTTEIVSFDVRPH